MATAIAIALPEAEGANRERDQRAYWSVSRALASAAGRQDHEAMRGLLLRREGLLAVLGTSGRGPSRALSAEVEALEAQTMLALGVEPPRLGVRAGRGGRAEATPAATQRASGYGA